MTIQDLGSIGELIAAIATVATLGYLAVQIRQNTRSVRASSRLAVSRTYNEHSRLRLDPMVNRAYLQGLRASPDMSFAERGTFANVLSDHWVFFQGAFALHEEGQLDRQTYDDYLTWFACQVATPGGRAFWSEVSAVGLKPAMAAVNERIQRGDLPDILQFSFNRMDP
ncbi:MAG: hypothetical protein PVF69_13350 [Gemmatimonadota bacterium]